MSRIGFIGNHQLDLPVDQRFTTEADRAWSFEQLGHEVVRCQENRTTSSQLLQIMPTVDLLLYSHTHAIEWEIEGLHDVFAKYKAKGVPTAAVHLDIWRGLEREKDVGREATWSAEHVFTADGSPETEALYKKHGVNHHYLPPGIKESSCYIADPNRKRYPHDVIFVGTRDYGHKEHPHRKQLVDWLAEVYGERFGHYGHDGLGQVRGHDLNVLYSSAKVAVGDSCFAGEREKYWSDRIPESTGRGALLLHPEVEGLDHKGVPTWPAGNYLHLRELIDYFLENDDANREVRRMGYEWTKKNRTYTVLAQEILDTIGI